MLLAGSMPLDDLLATLKATRPVFHSQGPGKVVFQQVRSSSTGRAALRA